jgi:hypothetical protein
MDVTSFLLAEWALWIRGILAAGAGYYLCRRRSFAAVAVALFAAYWAYTSISFIIEFRTEVLEQVGWSYVAQALIALLQPFAAMAFGFWCGRKATPNHGATANRRPAGQSDGSGESVSDCCSRPGVSGGGR